MKTRALGASLVIATALSGCFETPALQKITPTTGGLGCTGTSANGLFAGGTGSQTDPYRICSAVQFLNLSNLATSGLYFVLDSDLNFSGTPFHPIQTFGGILDGQNHSIQNVGFVSSEPSGIFAFMSEGGVIRRVNVQNISFQGGAYTGGLVGNSLLGTIEDVTVLNGIVRGGDFTGGIVGVCDRCVIQRVTAQVDVSGALGVGGAVGGLRGTMTQARAHGSVTGTNGYTGGLFGYGVSASASNCLATGTVVGTVDRVGGVVGSLASSSIAQCGATGNVSGPSGVGGAIGELVVGSQAYRIFSRGTVTGTGAAIGGIVGYNGGDILDGYHQGNVNAAGGTWVGGGVGFVIGGSVTNLYAAGSVTGAASVGGLIGVTAVAITNSYWDSDLYPGNNGLGSPLTTAQMGNSANFTGWDFASVWEMGLVFPALQWE